MSIDANVQTRIAEDIAALHALSDHPAGPIPTPPCHRNLQKGYALSLKTEKEIASDFAFLSSLRDETPPNITAVAVQETDGGGLRIFVAANASQKGSDTNYLEEIKRGFQAMAEVMIRAPTSEFNRGTRTSIQALIQAQATRDQLEADLLDVIIRVCRERILERARLEGSKSIADHLFEASKLLPRKKALGTPTQHLLRSSAERLLGDLIFLGAMTRQGRQKVDRTEEAIKYLIQSCWEVEKQLDTKAVLRLEVATNLPNFDRGKAWSIGNMIRKIGRYKTCAERLSRLARSIDAFRQVETVCVVLDQQSLKHLALSTRAESSAVFQRLVKQDGLSASQSSKILQKTSKLGLRFKGSLKMSQGKDARIHAEVQLVWHLNQHGVGKRPRVIESNKLACFLCCALVSSTGLYQVPRTHGKVYPGWRLPSTAANGMHKTFAETLEKYDASRLRELLRLGQISKRPVADCESSVTLSRTSMESVLTVVVEAEEAQEEEADMDEEYLSDASEGTIKATRSITPLASEQHSSLIQARQASSGGCAGRPDAVQGDTITLPTQDSPNRVEAVDWIAIPPGKTAHVSRNSRLRVLVEHEDLRRGGTGLKDCRARVRRLSGGELAQRCRSERIYDVEADLRPGEETGCGQGGDPVLIRLGDEVYVVEFDDHGGQSS